MFGGTIPSFSGHFDKRSPETSRCVECNGWRSDFLHYLICGCGVRSGGFPRFARWWGRSRYTRAHPSIHTHVGHYFHTIGPRMVACRDSSGEKPLTQQILWGNLFQYFNVVCGFTVRKSQIPHYKTRVLFKLKRKNVTLYMRLVQVLLDLQYLFRYGLCLCAGESREWFVGLAMPCRVCVLLCSLSVH